MGFKSKKKDMQLQYKRAYNCAYMLFKFYIITKTKKQCRMKADKRLFNDSLAAYTAVQNCSFYTLNVANTTIAFGLWRKEFKPHRLQNLVNE